MHAVPLAIYWNTQAMLLEEGCIVEFDRLAMLLANSSSKFCQLFKASAAEIFLPS